MQDPAVVGVARRRDFVTAPARVVGQFVRASPRFEVERRIGHDVIGFEIRVLILEEGIGGDFAQVAGDAANGQIHFGQLISRAGLLLPIDRDVFLVTAVAGDELHRLDKHAAAATTRIVDLAAVRLDHFRDQVDHALGRIELAATFAFGRCEFPQKVLVDPTDDVFFTRRACLRILNRVDVVDAVDQRRQFRHVDAHPREVVVRQGSFE